MCIIAYKPLNQKFDKGILERCYKTNGDGCGFCYAQDERVIIQKGNMDFEDFWQRINKVQNETTNPILAHFRLRSVGQIDDLNCHPFYIDNRHAAAHNGTLYAFANPKSRFSDTYHFIHYILKPLFARDSKFYTTSFGKFILEETIHLNKMVILSANSEENVILNEGAGVWDSNIWYSNNSYLPPPPPKKHNKKKQKGQRKEYYLKDDLLTDTLAIGNDEKLTAQQVSEIVHHFKKELKQPHCKLRDLVEKGIVIATEIKEEIASVSCAG